MQSSSSRLSSPSLLSVGHDLDHEPPAAQTLAEARLVERWLLQLPLSSNLERLGAA